jgi:hypothetical protein
VLIRKTDGAGNFRSALCELGLKLPVCRRGQGRARTAFLLHSCLARARLLAGSGRADISRMLLGGLFLRKSKFFLERRETLQDFV